MSSWNAGLPFTITFISLHIELYEIKKIDFQVKTALDFIEMIYFKYFLSNL